MAAGEILREWAPAEKYTLMRLADPEKTGQVPGK